MFALRGVASKVGSTCIKSTTVVNSIRHSGNKGSGKNSRSAAAAAAAAASAAGISALGISSVVLCDDEVLHPPTYDWDHKGPFSSFDHAAIRRGHQVYTQVCAACHSLELVSYRTLIGVAFSEDEVKVMTADIDVVDGPDDSGEMFERPGKPSDKFPSPYKNEEEGRLVNGGAYPPDLSLISKARHGGEDYLFALLTGYRDAPEGINLREGLYFNPFFPGGAISMPKQLQDGGVEYEDGTPATESQMARDVVTFLAWAAEPEHDERKRMGIQWVGGLIVMAAATAYYKRFRWSIIKTRQISYDKLH